MSKVVTAHTNTSHIHKQKKTDPESRKTGQEGEIDKFLDRLHLSTKQIFADSWCKTSQEKERYSFHLSQRGKYKMSLYRQVVWESFQIPVQNIVEAAELPNLEVAENPRWRIYSDLAIIIPDCLLLCVLKQIMSR